ncbi:MAG: metallophosphoesterase [Verrucomicrobiota bacterium]
MIKRKIRTAAFQTWLLAVCLAVICVGTTRAQESVTIAVTGDVYTPGAKIVSDAILHHPSVAAVLLAGDTCNTWRTPLKSYKALYQGTYDRFMDKIYPCPGNHDAYNSPAFGPYGEFWGRAAHMPQMYYSFDLGGWHIVSLDSVTLVKGGKPADAQLQWLKQDLAAKPQTPVLAFWHYPLFSNAKHRGNPKVKPYWDILYAHGPALIINGHNHVYERYGPLDPDGQAVPETKGLQEFSVSPGGAKPVTKESTPKGLPSKKFHGDAYHVGYFTLDAGGGFRYRIQAISSKGIMTVVDDGVGNLMGGPSPSGH